ncbi:hypothetical protein PHLGIDRAFT_12017 [Phlebiopsis gigantea 11061_1 CR5-6]|uniref:Methyltransferase domain-containing protein n=1 Tax=Phlebiopsis gigantea (strain 11061_1 CR5-6) TaxID=745531 RepID=A0A0C3NVH3_PHLG1|nr:hypothetical protein PHLGIDRAFT_12017 [Phlebiopsis gigantea 11061_1 CR5-6]
MVQIYGEISLHPSSVVKLDGSLFSIADHERDFFHKTISEDDNEVKARVLEIQQDFSQQHEYPCIYAFHFVTLYMDTNPIYSEVLAAGKSGNTLFLDLGCCMGTDVRKLVYDGYPASNVVGCDLRSEFIDFGHILYRDKGSCSIHFFAYDIFDVPYPVPTDVIPAADIPISALTTLSQLYGSVTHFYTGALFHLFDEPTQYALALRIATLLKRAPGAVIFGRHQGLQEPGLLDDYRVAGEKQRFGHSPSSWSEMWRHVFAEVESPEFADFKVTVQAELIQGWDRNRILGMNGRTDGMLFWSVKIV